MNDQPMRDMVPPEKDSRSIRDVQINKNSDSTEEGGTESESSLDNRMPRGERFNPRGRNKSYKGWFIVLGIIILIFVFISLTPVLSNADVEVTPKFQDVEITGDFQASPLGAEEGDIIFQTTTVELIGEENVPASGEEEVSRKAAGTIKIFNEFSEDAEQLIANTRFESEEGLIYRIQNPITIPGYSGSGNNINPGTIEVTVYADEAGEEYNTQSARFTIPGLEGDPRFDKMRAETVGSISGGFEGVTKVANEEDVEIARESLRESLGDGILEKAEEEIPGDFIMISETMSVRFESLPEESGANDEVIVKEKALATVALFKKEDVASFIAEETIGEYEGESVRIDNFESLNISVDGRGEELDPISGFVFSLSGDAKLVWAVDYESLEEDLYGVSKSEASEIISDYPSIKEVKIKISPFWRRSIPEEREKVSVTEVISSENN